MVQSVIVEKPSKALNLTYVVFGYVLSSVLVPELSVNEQMVAFVSIGSLLGTFLFLTKPIDRLLTINFLLAKRARATYV